MHLHFGGVQSKPPAFKLLLTRKPAAEKTAAGKTAVLLSVFIPTLLVI